MPKTFLHSGDLGDIVYAMPAMRDLGGGVVYLVTLPGTKTMTRERFDAVAPLLAAQPYIEDVRWWNKEKIDHDFTGFRVQYKSNRNLAVTQALYIGADPDGWSRKWIDVQPTTNGMVVIHRSPRYHNDCFPWLGLISCFGKRLLYCGLQTEYQEFARAYGDVEFYPTTDLLALAQMIAGSELFIGNQSSPYAVAEGLKHACILEQSISNPDCMFDRADCLHVVGGEFSCQGSRIVNPLTYFATVNGLSPIKVNPTSYIKWMRGELIGGNCDGFYATRNSAEIAALMARRGCVIRQITQTEYETSIR